MGGYLPRRDLESGEEEGVRSREQAQFVAPSPTGSLALFGLGRAGSAVSEYKKEDGILNTRPLRRMTISWNAVLQFQNRLWRFLFFFACRARSLSFSLVWRRPLLFHPSGCERGGRWGWQGRGGIRLWDLPWGD